MKRVIQFHKAFVPAAIGSALLIAFGLIGLATKGINMGVDFQAGLNQTVQLAYPVADVSYEG
ncbi:MAG: protein translocase subunit SecF, partial [Spirochaetia bacterium]|nr:protein translocase subunit SecF [Spirochaetia bacterium]